MKQKQNLVGGPGRQQPDLLDLPVPSFYLDKFYCDISNLILTREVKYNVEMPGNFTFYLWTMHSMYLEHAKSIAFCSQEAVYKRHLFTCHTLLVVGLIHISYLISGLFTTNTGRHTEPSRYDADYLHCIILAYLQSCFLMRLVSRQLGKLAWASTIPALLTYNLYHSSLIPKKPQRNTLQMGKNFFRCTEQDCGISYQLGQNRHPL